MLKLGTVESRRTCLTFYLTQNTTLNSLFCIFVGQNSCVLYKLYRQVTASFLLLFSPLLQTTSVYHREGYIRFPSRRRKEYILKKKHQHQTAAETVRFYLCWVLIPQRGRNDTSQKLTNEQRQIYINNY